MRLKTPLNNSQQYFFFSFQRQDSQVDAIVSAVFSLSRFNSLVCPTFVRLLGNSEETKVFRKKHPIISQYVELCKKQAEYLDKISTSIATPTAQAAGKRP